MPHIIAKLKQQTKEVMVLGSVKAKLGDLKQTSNSPNIESEVVDRAAPHFICLNSTVIL